SDSLVSISHIGKDCWLRHAFDKLEAKFRHRLLQSRASGSAISGRFDGQRGGVEKDAAGGVRITIYRQAALLPAISQSSRQRARTAIISVAASVIPVWNSLISSLATA
ncbi:hypothetical protein, partial [Mesorhizobium sp. M7A.F.Ca.CA.004.05.2.1]|uniref:hypothetical protein n=1 Tax=Mesorhizobium sp. M7A.F.Ca.CA.004.05.2.1 TaxID=2496716 RepID=UPI0019D1A5AC